ncbi:MAG: flagellar biosynthetic protein FliR [Paracoccus sp. (in: a-proteobacteria)]|uniref:flagellar biosynthetic protein FliR n=1 Tax=Paracoccus sp. TaxID=267 RepID=UPI0026DEAF86|nr:flagellar biosynthetic protein FliR [Paracoccus sp. (in: a-proteobacteria)]MDO5620001.1 flagellar biosynthetic protein FliR [Paracoccus sp. (in: a-proteobacteria)]
MLNGLAAAVPGLDMGLVLTYLRLQAFLLMLPGIGERMVPGRVKVAIAMSLAPLLSGISGPGPDTADAAGLLLPALTEIAVGLAAGTLVRIMAFAIDIGTSAIAASTSLAQIVGGANEASPHPVGNMLHLGGIAILFTLGLPVMMVQLLADSFVLWPLGAVPDIAAILPEIVSYVARSFGLAMTLAAPFILGGFLYQALSGVINKVMPQLPVLFIGAPGSILLALVALVVIAPLLVAVWADAVLSISLPGVP